MTLRNAFEDLATEATLAALEAKTPALSGGRVPVDIGSATVSIGASVEVSNDAGNPLPISDAGGSITVDAASLPLPTGAATSAKQDTLIAAVDGVEGVLGTIDADTSALAGTVAGGAVTVADGGGSITVDGPLTDAQLRAAAVPVSAASLPLPTGAATAANQSTGNSSLSSIDGKLAALQSGAVPVGDNGGSLTVDGRCYRFAGTFTRPANTTQYTAGDAIGDAGGSAIITLSNIGPSGGFIQIQSIRLLIYSGTLPTTMSGLRLHLFQTSPTAIADNAQWDLVSGDRSTYLDYIDLPTPTDMGSTLFTKADYPGSLLKLADGSTSLFGVLQTLTNATFAENSTVVDLRISAIEMSR